MVSFHFGDTDANFTHYVAVRGSVCSEMSWTHPRKRRLFSEYQMLELMEHTHSAAAW